MRNTLVILVAFLAFISNAQVATKLDVADTRFNNEAPSFYDKGIRADFKHRINLSIPGTGNYGTTLSVNPWTNLDNSGNKVHQLHFNDGGLFYRNALPLDATWGAWRQLLMTNDSGNLDFSGTIFAGAQESVSGQNILSGRYSIGTISNWGSLRSTSSSFMGFGVKAKTVSPGGWVSSTSISTTKSAITTDSNGFHVYVNSVNQSVAEGADITLDEYFSVRESGNVGIGTNYPLCKLDIRGESYSYGHTIQAYSPLLFLKRNTDAGGYIQGVQSQLFDGTNNWFSGNLGVDEFRISKGDYQDAKLIVKSNGNVGIGVINPQFKLDVYGKSSFTDNMKVNAKIEAKELKVTNTPTADFVFEKNYDLPKLEEVEKHIKMKKHLPEIASAKEMEKEGVNVGEFQIKLLQKIEELTLYTIEQNKMIQAQNQQIIQQNDRIKKLESKLKL